MNHLTKLANVIETIVYLFFAALALGLGLIATAITRAVAPVLAAERRWRPRNLARIRSAQATIRARMAQAIAPAHTVTDES